MLEIVLQGRIRESVANRIHMIDSAGMSHVHISGLTFHFTNVYWNLTAAPYWGSGGPRRGRHPPRN